MASLPPQRPQARRAPSSSQQDASSQSAAPQRESSQSPSSKSVDSQTLVLNNSLQSNPPQQRQDPLSAPAEDNEPRKCWICLQDETDDGPHASPWRSPCPCALTAHEQCLLDWIADMEAPDSSHYAPGPKRISCPQCKSEIHLIRPRNLVIEVVSRIEEATGNLVLPGIITGLSYGLQMLLSHHGAYTIRMIFGDDDAERILMPASELSFLESQLHLYAPALIRPWFSDWRGIRLELGLPLIPACLVASRTTLADTVLPFLPVFFFATLPQLDYDLADGFWPPTPAFTLMALPYLRSFYDEYMEHVWGERERAWAKELRPCLGHDDGADAEDDDYLDDEDANDVVEVAIDIEFGHDGEEEHADEGPAHHAADAPPPIARNEAPALDAPPQDRERERERARDEAQRAAEERVAAQIEHVMHEAAAARAVRADDHNDNHNNVGPHHGDQFNIDLLWSVPAQTVLGALLFPSVCAGVGEALRVVLPASWTARRAVPTGLLQTRWGRSIVGGCMFVVLKDAVRIYCRWKMVQAFRRRRVQDYDKKTHRVAAR